MPVSIRHFLSVMAGAASGPSTPWNFQPTLGTGQHTWALRSALGQAGRRCLQEALARVRGSSQCQGDGGTGLSVRVHRARVHRARVHVCARVRALGLDTGRAGRGGARAGPGCRGRRQAREEDKSMLPLHFGERPGPPWAGQLLGPGRLRGARLLRPVGHGGEGGQLRKAGGEDGRS